MNKFKNKKILNTVLKKQFSKKTLSFQQKFVFSVFSQKNWLGSMQTNKEKFLVFESRRAKVFLGYKNSFDQKNQINDFGFGLWKQNFKTKRAFQKQNTIFSASPENQKLFLLFVAKKNFSTEPIFFNFAFDKNRLKNVVAWFLERYGQYKTIQFLEKLKGFGFGYATKGGLSLGIDDLKIPNNKIALIAKAETKVSKDLMDFRNAKITGVERMQRLIYTWNQTNDMLKQEVIKYFETIDLFNPIYMMAFSGARGNMSQVRQLVGMRGLMSDPQGQIIDFPIQSNFREGLTLTEYLISTYGARKGIVDTALRTATAGYLTRRLVDVAQHVIVSQFDCQTSRGIFLFDMKEANKTIYSFQNRLVGRVLAQDIFSTNEINNITEKKLVASRNQEIDSKFAFAISKVTKKALVRSPLTCETPRLICQLCYGWSLSQGKLVSLGEAVGVIAAQSIGEPGTQLTMRTFHTGGVFAGGLTDQILSPFDGKIQYFHNIPGSCIRISLSEIAFFTKTPGSFCVLRGSKTSENIDDSSFNPHFDETYVTQFENNWKQKNKNSNFSEIYKIPAYAVLFMRNHEFVQKTQVLAQFSTVANKQLQYGSAEQTLYSNLAGEFYLNTSSVPFQKKDQFQKLQLFVETRSSDSFDLSLLELKNDIIWKVKDWTNLWILSGKVFYNSFDSNLFIKNGDFLKKTTAVNRILWRKPKTWNFFGFQKKNDFQEKKKKNMFYLMAFENFKNSKPFPFFVQKSFSSSSVLNSTFDQNCKIFPCFSFSFRKNKKMKNSLFNIWKTSSKQTTFYKKIFKQKKENFMQKNLTLKILFDVSKNTSMMKFQLFPFQPFSSNFKNSNKKQTKKNQKFLKPKKDIIFLGNFQRFFVFSQKQKKFKKQKKETTNYFISKIKNPLKQIFVKFSTFARSSPFFRIYHFAKKFNTSQKFVKKASFSKTKVFKNKYYFSKFLLSKKYLTKIFYKLDQSVQKEYFVPFFKNSKKWFIFENKNYKKIFSAQKENQFFANFFSFKNKNSTFLFTTSFLKFSFLNTFIFLQNVKTTKTFSQKLSFQKTNSQQIILKKTVLCFHYEKIRYKKFGYFFSFFDSSTNKNTKNSLLSFRTFTTLKQTVFDENKKINYGKQQTGLAFANENFFGKDISTFLSYCFPKNYQTFTNGIFTFFVFENLSKKQKFMQFLCLKEKSPFDFFKTLKAGKNQNKKNHQKKNNSFFQSQKNLFLISSPFSFVLQNKSAFSQNLFPIQKRMNVLQDSWRTTHKQKEYSTNFFYNLKKTKITDCNHLSFDLLFGLKKLKSKSTFNRFFNFEVYTEEIFWIPQENYTFSILNFSKKNENSFNVKRNQNYKKQKQDKIKSYVSDIIFQKTPLFYSSNHQGKKKPFFPLFDGIWHCASFANKIKYQQSSSFKKKNFFSKNTKKLQQKISFYQYQNKKVQNQKKNSLPFFCCFKRNKKRKYFQKISLQKKNFYARFLHWKFLFQNFSKTKISKKNSFLFKQKNRRFFKFSPKFSFSKEFNKELKSNIFLLFKNKQKKSNFQKSQKIFNKVQLSTFFQKVKIQDKIGQFVNSNCLTCFPLQKSNKNLSLSSKNFKNIFKTDDQFGFSHLTDIDFLKSNTVKTTKLESKQMHLTIQSGWLCVFENSSFILNSHQTTAKQGQFFAKNLCFEQNKIFKEAIFLKKSALCSKPQNMNFKQTFLNSDFEPFQKKNKNFSVQSVQRNYNCRFQNNGSFVAFENFVYSFEKNEALNQEKIFESRGKKTVQIIGFDQDNFKINSKLLKPIKKIALFIRPMHYKLLENPKNYKKYLLNTTIQKGLQKNSIFFISSLKIYKKYHSTVLNCQKAHKNFLHHFKNVDSLVYSAFEKIHSLKTFRKRFVSRMPFVRRFRTSFKKNQNFLDFRLSKKDTIKKSLNFKLYSKKTILSKFKNVLNRDFSQHLVQLKNENQTYNLKHCSSQFYQKGLKKNIQNNYFFSFYPIQFLPLSIYHSSWNNSSFHFKTSQTLPTLFFNAVNSTIDFSICEKKAAFLNQRFIFFKKSFETTLFWLNKDGLKFMFSELFAQKNYNNFWKQSFSLLLKTNTIEKNKQNFFSKKIRPSKTQQVVQNFIFKKNSVFYANTKFLSPFEGEVLPMHMNETNWWKKASEISTIQKLNTLFTVVTKNDLFTLSFSKTNFQNQKFKNSEFLTLSQQNGKNQHSVENEKKEKYPLQNKQYYLHELYRFILNKQKRSQNIKSFDFQKQKQSSPNSFKENSVFLKNQKIATFEISSFCTKYENKLYTFKNLKIDFPKLSKKPSLGKFFVYGDCVSNFAIRKPGQIVHISFGKVTLRCGQPFLVSPKGILHLTNTPYIQKNIPILTLAYQTVQSGDIVQGIPKVEQLFEARTTIQGRLFLSSLPILLKGIFERYKTMFPLEQAVRQSFLKIQQLIVDGVQRVYRSQGVSIVDKHLEVIVRQMTTKVQILHGAQTGFFPGELVNLDLVERINKFLLVKIRYEPVVLGITRSSLEVDSFLSASSFQQTTKILALASISRKKDFLKGLKENILVGNLMPSGTGYMVLRKNL
uniref:RNA polymerase beta'' subunit n=1 Tax=Tetradesmus bajacalifornicus TaxID=269609 RepID=UPI00300215A7|nr:RNA polymerase beta'' subunit [Tetradesmus bajacalifornicus]